MQVGNPSIFPAVFGNQSLSILLQKISIFYHPGIHGLHFLHFRKSLLIQKSAQLSQLYDCTSCQTVAEKSIVSIYSIWGRWSLPRGSSRSKSRCYPTVPCNGLYFFR